MSASRPIILCGFMASGKSAIGKELAKLTDMEFLDLDKVIENKENRSISQIFEERGEAYFRKLEEINLKEIVKNNASVIALGGGTLLNPDLFDLVHTKGHLVFINTSLETIKERLKRNNKRPILQNDDGSRMEDSILEEYVDRLHKKRLPIYVKAPFIYTPIDGTAAEQASRIMNLLKNHA
jgi:shikimate kinase